MKSLIDFAAIRRDRQALVDVLQQAGCTFKGNLRACRCPFHEDKTPSACIKQDESGEWRFKCHAGSCGFSGDVLDVRAKLNGRTRNEEIEALREGQPAPAKTKADAPKTHATLEELQAAAERSDREGGKCAKTFQYTNPETRAVDLVVFRIERPDGSKSFRQGTPHGDGWVLRGPKGKWPLYNRARVATAEIVFVVEGEKAVHALHGIGIVATTAPGGAGKASFADWTPLAGRIVYLWPDADPVDPKTGKRTGIEHMREVQAELEKLPNAPRTSWIDPDRLDLPPKGDAFEFVNKHGPDAREAVWELTHQAEPLGPLADLDRDLKDAREGRRFVVPLPWPMLSKATRALLPGTVTILAGSPGATKSLCTLQALTALIQDGTRCAALELEDGAAYHLRRALAQIEGNSDLTDDDWCYSNPEAVKDAQARNRDILERLATCIESLPTDTKPTAENLGAWVARKAASGCRVVLMDPVTMMQKSRAPWEDDNAFLYTAKGAIEEYKASLVLVSHPRKLAAGQRTNALTLDDLAGGAAYARFAQTVLCLTSHKSKTEKIKTQHGSVSEAFNRSLSILKARNGRGVEGNQYACHFDGRTLTMREIGEVEE